MSTIEATGAISGKHFNNRSLLNTLAPLAPYLDDPDTFELRVNKFGQLVSVTTRGRVFHDLPWLNKAYLERLTGTLLNANTLDPLPVNDLMLPDGSRVVIAWPPAVLEGTVLMASAGPAARERPDVAGRIARRDRLAAGRPRGNRADGDSEAPCH
ncbi:hypothetical protein [Burkholderia pseudomallei]|uniref:hypothetical protein n=1 Tax=Burkholderia pseudomallei TaxID=28450 RepID=UPI000A691239|nr:hypothetical protein [Burkholderia pseudomallei]